LVPLVWAGTAFLVLIAVVMVTRRTLSLSGLLASRTAMSTDVDAGFSAHPVLTFVHMLPGLAFMVLGPLQFVPSLRARRPALHRVSGRIVLVSAVIVGVTALVMSPRLAIGGINETVAVWFFATYFLVAATQAFLAIRRGDVVRHREWMIRMFAIGAAVAAIRPIVGVFFATSRATALTPREFFGTAFWLGFSLMAVVAEVWIGRTRRLRDRASAH
jgi:uncharacterized membrane protein